MKTLALDGQAAGHIKPIAGKATKKATQFFNNFSFDPHPTRSKIIFGLKVGIPALITGMLIRHKSAK